MTIDEIAQTLPNGFHDAEVSSITINYAVGEVVLKMDVWIGEFDSFECNDNTYRAASLILSGLIYCVIEPPGEPPGDLEPYTLTIDSGAVESLTRPPTTKLPSETVAGAFTNWFFVGEWNSFFYISAKEAKLVWEGELIDRG